MRQIQCEGDTGPHGQTGAIIAPEPLQFEEKPTQPEDNEDTVADPTKELLN